MNLFSLPAAEIESLVLNATPSRLVVLTYDGAIQSLERAIAMIDAGEIESRYWAVEKATDFVTELYMSLDHEQGGEIAQNLGCIYTFILSRLPRINFYNDKQTAADCIALLKQLRDSWDELDAQIAANDSNMAPNSINTAQAGAR